MDRSVLSLLDSIDDAPAAPVAVPRRNTGKAPAVRPLLLRLLPWLALGLLLSIALLAPLFPQWRDSSSWVVLLMAMAALAVWLLTAVRADQRQPSSARGSSFDALGDHLPQPAARFDGDQRIAYANPDFVAAFGRVSCELSGRRLGELGLASETERLLTAALQRVRERGRSVHLCLELPAENATRTWDALLLPEFDGHSGSERANEHANVSGVMLICHEAQAQAQAQRRPAEVQARGKPPLTWLLNSMPAVVYSAPYAADVDCINDCSFCSDTVEAMLGHRAERFMQEPGFWRTLLHPADAESVARAMASLEASRHLVLEYRIRHANGHWRWLRDEMRLIPPPADAPAGAPPMLLGSCVDITGRREAEDAAHRLVADMAERAHGSHTRYRTIFDTMPMAAAEEDWSGVRRLLLQLRDQGVTDLRGWIDAHPEFARHCLAEVRLLHVNARARELLGVPDALSLPTRLEKVLDQQSDLPPFIDELQALWQGRERHMFRCSRRNWSGQADVDLLITMSLPSLAGGDALVLVCYVDITEIDRLNAELQRSLLQAQRANRELQTFTYSVSHDLKTPLRGIDGYSRLLLRDHEPQLDAEARQFLRHIRRATQQMGHLIDDLLDYARLDQRRLQRSPQALDLLLHSVIDEMSDATQRCGARLHNHIPAGFSALGDADGLRIVLRNLLDNALKFGRPGVPPSITVDALQLPGGGTRICVRDDGMGFDMKYHDRIFEIFQRLHRAEDFPGTGVGLAMVRRAVERMDGTVWAESRPGEGATFIVELPGPGG